MVGQDVSTFLNESIAGGAVTIVRGEDKLFWYWTGKGTAEPQVSAAAVLSRVGP